MSDRDGLLHLDGYRKWGGHPPGCLGHLDLQQPLHEQHVLRMLLTTHLEPRIPTGLLWCKPLVDIAVENQWAKTLPNPYVYLTVRHGWVQSEKDDEWHVDGFAMRVPHVVEQNYVWCDHTPTEFMIGDVSLPNGFDPMRHNIHTTFGRNSHLISRPSARSVLRLDPYDVHRRPASTHGLWRTFIRVSCLPIPIHDVNNTQNPLLYVPHGHRDGVREFRNKLEPWVSPE